MSRSLDERPPAQRALEVARGLKAGTWESVETLALLAAEVDGEDRATLLEDARSAAARLKAGSWESVRALALLARAGRETQA